MGTGESGQKLQPLGKVQHRSLFLLVSFLNGRVLPRGVSEEIYPPTGWRGKNFRDIIVWVIMIMGKGGIWESWKAVWMKRGWVVLLGLLNGKVGDNRVRHWNFSLGRSWRLVSLSCVGDVGSRLGTGRDLLEGEGRVKRYLGILGRQRRDLIGVEPFGKAGM